MKNITRVGLTLLLSSAISFASANDVIIKEQTNLEQDGKKIGFVKVLTPVEKVKTKNGKTTIRIKGFRLKDYPQDVVRDMKRGELYAQFNDENIAVKSFKVIKKYEDDYGEIWQEVEGDFVISSKQISKDPEKLRNDALKLYERTCSMCHHLPKSTAYTVNQWPHLIESMMVQVPLEIEPKTFIIKYLQQHASDAK
ncbi:MAG: hypothetical protein ACI9RG_000432 [Sulfurimonas sp.]